MLSRRVLVGASVLLAPFAAAGGQNAAAVQSAPPPVRISGLAQSGSSNRPFVPQEAGGYRLADTSSLSDGGKGVEYVYKQGQFTMRVLIGPYPAVPPSTLTDTMTLVQSYVEPIRDAVEQAGQDAQLQAYHKLVDRADQVRIGAQIIHSYWYFAEVQGIGTEGHYVYYAAYALPTGVVQIRGDLPWDAPPPANSMSMSMVPVTPMAVGAGVESVEDPAGVMGGGLQNQGGPGSGAGGGLATESNPGALAPPVANPGAASANSTTFTTFSNDLVGAMVQHHAAAAARAPAPAAAPVPPIPAACAAVPAPTDTVTYRVYASLVAPGRGDSLPAAYLGLVLDALRQSYKVPNPLRPRVVVPMVVGGNAIVAPAVFGEVGFTLDAQGKLSDAGLSQSSLSPSMDRSLYNAVRLADSLQAFPAQIGVAHQGPVRFFVDLTSYQPRGSHSAPLFEVRLAAWHPGSRPAVNVYVKPSIPAGSPAPTAGDSALIQFAIDNSGVPIKSTMRLIGATNLEIAEAVVHAALQSRYVPAMAAGCPVNGLLELSWRMAQ